MLSSNKLQDDVIAKEEKKIALKRQQHEERRLRILNAKVRLIGLDIQTLDQQVAEKQKRRQLDNELDKFEQSQAIEIERHLAAASEEEAQMRAFQMAQMKQSWEQAKELRRQQLAGENRPDVPDFDHANAGPSSALKFTGEDPKRVDRIAQQKEQMRRWVQEQLAEKAQLRHLSKEEDLNYAEMLRAIDLIREANEREEQQLRKYLQDSVKEHNRQLSEQQRSRNAGRDGFGFNADGSTVLTSLPAFTASEDRALALDEHGHVIRRDLFRGFTDEQKRKILLENQEILRQKSAKREEEKRKELDWLQQQLMALRAMENAEYEEKSMREALKTDQLSFLQQQMEQQRRDREAWERSKYGDISSGFFDGFGKSHR